MKLSTILAALFLASPAVATGLDKHEMHRSGHWIVNIMVDDNTGEVGCELTSEQPDLENDWNIMSVSTFSRNQHPLLLISIGNAHITRGRTAQIDDFPIRVGRVDWTLHDAEITQHPSGFVMVAFEAYREDMGALLSDLSAGSWASVPDAYGNELAGFSLRGSAAAVQAFYTCVSRL